MTSRLYLLLRLGADRYAIESSLVEEVVSVVRLKELPGAPSGAAGVMNFRGQAVPVVDLGLLALGAPTTAHRSTRIVIVRYRSGMQAALLGLLVPEVTETQRLDPDDFRPATMATDGAPYLGRLLATPEGVIQSLSIADLLTPALRDALYRETEPA